MDLELDGRIALISGASGGIGSETARALAKEGAQTILVARRRAQLQALADEIAEERAPRPMVVVEDLTKRDSYERIREKVTDAFGGVDLLINNLGQARPFDMKTPDSEWDAAFELNFTPTRKLTEIFIDGMQQRRFGRIINLTSKSEPTHVSGSLTSKAAVVMWAKGLSRLVGKDGITVNCVTPGILMTDQIRDHFLPKFMPTREDQQKFLDEEVPMRRFGDPADAAHLIVFLCSTKAGYITGQRIYVDGGKIRHI
jgi:3-oxoacyl-[acyl-carrier protein] reductase